MVASAAENSRQAVKFRQRAEPMEGEITRTEWVESSASPACSSGTVLSVGIHVLTFAEIAFNFFPLQTIAV